MAKEKFYLSWNDTDPEKEKIVLQLLKKTGKDKFNIIGEIPITKRVKCWFEDMLVTQMHGFDELKFK